jgi:small subunit ribosomal protein S8
MLDPIADMLTRIRNAQSAGHKEVVIPFSKLKMGIAVILEKNDFINAVQKDTTGKFPAIKIALKYITVSNTEKNPAISEIKRISKEGQRIYAKKSDLKRVKNGYGISVVSTSKGLMTGDAARKSGLGGEIICEVW